MVVPAAELRVQPAAEAAVRSPLVPTRVAVRVIEVLSGSVTVAAENGVEVCASVIDWAAVGLATAGASCTGVMVPEAALVPWPSVTLAATVSVSVLPSATAWATGWNTRPRKAACAAAAAVPDPVEAKVSV